MGFGFNAPLTLISLTYLIMHLASLSIRARLRRKEAVEGGGGGDRNPLLQQLSWRQWAWKVFPVAAASGLEVSSVCRQEQQRRQFALSPHSLRKRGNNTGGMSIQIGKADCVKSF